MLNMDENAINNAEWIVDHPDDFTTLELSLAEAIVTIKEPLTLLVQYNWGDELRDFEQMTDEVQPDAGDEWHIFQRIVTLDNFLNNTNHTAESYINREAP
jgi:hypothetical protein